jgi:hypothetical protein
LSFALRFPHQNPVHSPPLPIRLSFPVFRPDSRTWHLCLLPPTFEMIVSHLLLLHLISLLILSARGGAVVEALHYKPEGSGIDSQWCHWNFSLTQSFRPPHYGPGVDSASNINEYQEYFLG